LRPLPLGPASPPPASLEPTLRTLSPAPSPPKRPRRQVSERDALLPAVATLLQATPAEFGAMQRVLANTAPPGAQVLSVLGIKI
jgi:hypothetical protein